MPPLAETGRDTSGHAAGTEVDERQWYDGPAGMCAICKTPLLDAMAGVLAAKRMGGQSVGVIVCEDCVPEMTADGWGIRR